jgi:hypothetical protein
MLIVNREYKKENLIKIDWIEREIEINDKCIPKYNLELRKEV